MAVTEEPILSRIDRLDTMLKQLEEIRGGGNRSFTKTSSSSGASTPSSREGHASLSSSSMADVSPESLKKHCRPIDLVIMETETRGTLIDRLDHVEDRLLKMEEELEVEKEKTREPKKKKKGLKYMVKKVIGGGEKHETKSDVQY